MVTFKELQETTKEVDTKVNRHEFSRPKGFAGSLPRNWIDNNLPNCPFCKQPTLWELRIEKFFIEDAAFRPRRYYFRCPNCLAILSIPTASVVYGRFSITAISGIKFKIEDIGNNPKFQHLANTEQLLETLQKLT